MKAFFYQKLQGDFVMIRFLQAPESFEQAKYDAAILSIKDARKKISVHSAPSEKDVLLYCIDTLFAIINEGDRQKTFDFADAIHNIPEIYMQKRNLYSFRQELKAFQKKYGKHYFPFIDKVKPRFTKKAPKNKWHYFSASADEDFKKLHPLGYKLLCVIGCFVLLFPMLVYGVFIGVHPPRLPESSASVADLFQTVLGLVGTFIFGVGLFNIVAAWIHQYLGHAVTAVCLLGGTALTALALYLQYT